MSTSLNLPMAPYPDMSEARTDGLPHMSPGALTAGFGQLKRAKRLDELGNPSSVEQRYPSTHQSSTHTAPPKDGSCSPLPSGPDPAMGAEQQKSRDVGDRSGSEKEQHLRAIFKRFSAVMGKDGGGSKDPQPATHPAPSYETLGAKVPQDPSLSTLPTPPTPPAQEIPLARMPDSGLKRQLPELADESAEQSRPTKLVRTIRNAKGKRKVFWWVIDCVIDVEKHGEELIFTVRWEDGKVGLKDVWGVGALEQCEQLVVEKFGQETWDEHVAGFPEGRRYLTQKASGIAASHACV